MYKLVFFVPASHKEKVKQAVFDQGAGQYDGYDCCSWESMGQGQFKPLTNSQPFIGKPNSLQTVEEYRVEMICADDKIKAVLEALITAHPYEVPAYDVQKVYFLDDF